MLLVFISRKKGAVSSKCERLFALSLLVMELLYHVWLIGIGRWGLSDSFPLELCSISLIAAILLLWTGNPHLYNFVFFAGIGGAIQAIATLVLDLGFPHFRYIHFFYTHIGIILTALYFTWVKAYRPTFKGVLTTIVILNGLLPIIFTANMLFNGNYMFLREKPLNGSLLDYLGAYPWYILSLDVAAFIMFLCLWLMFRKWKTTSEG
ncbi:TIGR02206 family membrane protein [Sporosarcina sp. FSL K6-1522]|uniref:YwaF family protein n=1 Tax=Sporosarcina sp. FSL K6-1522 TaxID=2921554 RepID=UPI003159C275